MVQAFKSIRNVAVIAHVDHGKTTLVDAMLKQSKVFRDNEEEMSQERILDRNDLERERGITILAKNCAIHYGETKINIIDTPGHVDFSGEVERTLSMADGVLLIVDAQEGPMPQTRTVLKQALKLGLKVIVVINKIDKKFAQVPETISAIETLFLELVTSEEQLNFPTLYAVGRAGAVFNSYDPNLTATSPGDVKPLLETIVREIPPSVGDTSLPPKMLVSSIDYDVHVGRITIGKLAQGIMKKGTRLSILQTKKTFGVEHLYMFEGLGRLEVSEVRAGDILALTGAPDIQIGMTVATNASEEAFPAPAIGEPTLHMVMGVNTSPFAGREGKFVTSRQLDERLDRELESNLSLRVEKLESGRFRLSGRGELHLSVLLETMRREGYEMEVAKPKAITKIVDGAKLEPFERVEIVIPKEHEGAVHKECGRRFADLNLAESVGNEEVRLVFEMPTRATLGLRSALLTMTKGTLLYSSEFLEYRPLGRILDKMRSGVLIASHSGQSLAYGLDAAQQRGSTLIGPGIEVYEGMIVGQTNRDEDIRINVTKGKQLTNMRSKSSDGVIQLAPPTELSLEQCLDFLEGDELLEITPTNLRLRKKNLTGIFNKRMGEES
ncbi:MAG: GTP-binding protein [bacterium]